MNNRRREVVRALCCALLAAGLGCATAGGGSGTGDPGRRASRDVIAEAELEGMGELSAFEAIRRLRPVWLRGRGQSSFSGSEVLRIYRDGSFYGEDRSLEAISVKTIREIRFLDASEATLRFGTGHPVGAILVTSKGGG
jgi:hypothetical protein